MALKAQFPDSAAETEPPLGIEKESPNVSVTEDAETVLQVELLVLRELTATAMISFAVTPLVNEAEHVELDGFVQMILTWTTLMLPLITVRVSPDPPQRDVKPLLLPSVSVKVACQ